MSNILPQTKKVSILWMYRKRFLAVVFIFIMCFAIVGSVLLVPAFLISRSSENLLTAQRDTLAGRETSTITHSLASTIGDINSRVAVFPLMVPASPLIADLINPILAAKTSTIHLTDFSYDPSAGKGTAAITIGGAADSREALLAFGDKLKTIDGITNVNVPISSFIKDANVPFTISATMQIK